MRKQRRTRCPDHGHAARKHHVTYRSVYGRFPRSPPPRVFHFSKNVGRPIFLANDRSYVPAMYRDASDQTFKLACPPLFSADQFFVPTRCCSLSNGRVDKLRALCGGRTNSTLKLVRAAGGYGGWKSGGAVVQSPLLFSCCPKTIVTFRFN